MANLCTAIIDLIVTRAVSAIAYVDNKFHVACCIEKQRGTRCMCRWL